MVAVHKSNVLRKSDGLFAQVCREVSEAHPTISFSEMLVDSAAMNLIREPALLRRHSDHEPLRRHPLRRGGPARRGAGDDALREHRRGLRPLRAGPRRGARTSPGRGSANPVAMILTVAMMLDWLSKTRQRRGVLGGRRLRSGTRSTATLETGVRTPDLGGKASTIAGGGARSPRR